VARDQRRNVNTCDQLEKDRGSVKRIGLIILAVGLVTLSAVFAFRCEAAAVLLFAIGMRLAYGVGPAPPLTDREVETIKDSAGGIFLHVFAIELAVLGAVWLLGYYFSRLTRKFECNAPTPWIVWGVRLALLWEGAVDVFQLIASAYLGYWFPAGALGLRDVVPMLLIVLTTVVGTWGTLGVSRLSKPTLLVCLVLLSVYELAPLLRFAFRSVSDPWFHGSPGPYSLRGPIFLAAIVLVMTSRLVRAHFRGTVLKAHAT